MATINVMVHLQQVSIFAKQKTTGILTLHKINTVLIETAEDNAWTIPEGLEDDELDDLTLRWCDAWNTVGTAINPL